MVVRKASLFSLPSSYASSAGAIVRQAIRGWHHKETIKLLKIDEVEEYREGLYLYSDSPDNVTIRLLIQI